MPRSVFHELVREGIIYYDAYYDHRACHVPPGGLVQFNEAIKQGTSNSYYPQRK